LLLQFPAHVLDLNVVSLAVMQLQVLDTGAVAFQYERIFFEAFYIQSLYKVGSQACFQLLIFLAKVL
jgi:hypothetical protein